MLHALAVSGACLMKGSMDPTTAAKEGRSLEPAGAWLTSAPKIMVRWDVKNCAHRQTARRGRGWERNRHKQRAGRDGPYWGHQEVYGQSEE